MSDQKSVDLVLEGGGVKGIALLGAVLVLADAGYRFERVAGTSAGSIVASLIASYQKAGRDLHELEDVMRGTDYRKFEDADLLERVGGVAGQALDGLIHEGAYTGDYLYDWLGPILAGVGVTTFRDLRIEDAGMSLRDYQRYSVVLHATDVSRHCLVRLPWDYDEYGLAADDQWVVDAVRASMSAPYFFRPVDVTTGSGHRVTWVDGGLLSNFPITVFDRTDGQASRWPTWGVKLSGRPSNHDEPVRNSAALIADVAQLFTAEWDRYKLADEGVNARTIFVDTTEVPSLNFNLTSADQNLLFERGQAAGQAFLKQVRQ